MAARDAGEHGPRQRRLALDGAPGGHHGQRPGGRDAERVHGLADDVLAKHRPDRGETVAAARERRGARPLEVKVAKPAVGRRELRPATVPGRRRGAERSHRTGVRRRPGPPAPPRRGPGCRSRKRSPSWPRSQPGSMPSSVASGSLRTSRRGSGAASACQRTASSGNSRAKRSSRATACIRCNAHPTQTTEGHRSGL